MRTEMPNRLALPSSQPKVSAKTLQQLSATHELVHTVRKKTFLPFVSEKERRHDMRTEMPNRLAPPSSQPKVSAKTVQQLSATHELDHTVLPQ
ncbi:hypothetical protein L1887_01432 [Cichorium endivia]|nr:hypothetical protein L1887_01432 [Cichorium endivia]